MLSVQLYDIWTPDVQQKRNGICCGVETRVYGIVFVQPGVKVNGDYYREVLLKEKLLPCIKKISCDNFIFQQDSAPAHRARDTIALLRRETPDYFFRPVSPKQPRYEPRGLQDLGCNATAGLRETRKWRRRAVPAPVECVAQHWTKRHRQSDRSVACATHRRAKGVILSTWCKIDLNWMLVQWLDISSQFWIEYDLVVHLHT